MIDFPLFPLKTLWIILPFPCFPHQKTWRPLFLKTTPFCSYRNLIGDWILWKLSAMACGDRGQHFRELLFSFDLVISITSLRLWYFVRFTGSSLVSIVLLLLKATSYWIWLSIRPTGINSCLQVCAAGVSTHLISPRTAALISACPLCCLDFCVRVDLPSIYTCWIPEKCSLQTLMRG